MIRKPKQRDFEESRDRLAWENSRREEVPAASDWHRFGSAQGQWIMLLFALPFGALGVMAMGKRFALMMFIIGGGVVLYRVLTRAWRVRRALRTLDGRPGR